MKNIIKNDFFIIDTIPTKLMIQLIIIIQIINLKLVISKNQWMTIIIPNKNQMIDLNVE